MEQLEILPYFPVFFLKVLFFSHFDRKMQLDFDLMNKF